MSDKDESSHSGNKVTWNTLANKRAELVLEIKQLEDRMQGLRSNLVHLDATLRILRPDFAAEDLPVRHRRPERSPYFKRGEITERIQDALRENGVIASADVAIKAMRDNGLDPDHDKPTRTDFVRRITLQLMALARKDQVEKIGGPGRNTRWQLKKS